MSIFFRVEMRFRHVPVNCDYDVLESSATSRMPRDAIPPRNCFARNNIPFNELPSLVDDGIHAHQLKALQKLHARWVIENQRIALVVCPTGCGKSGIAILSAYMLGSQNVLVITPSMDLSQQFHQSFCGAYQDPSKAFVIARNVYNLNHAADALPNFGGTVLYNASQMNDLLQTKDRFVPTQTLLVANAQKFGANSNTNLADFSRDFFDFVIVDEAHHYPATTWDIIVKHFKAKHVLFITATPNIKWKQDIQPSYCLQLSEAIHRQIIRNIEFRQIKTETDLLQQIIQQLSERPGHKAMILSQGVTDGNVYRIAEKFSSMARSQNLAMTASTFVGGDGVEILQEFMNPASSLRTLIVCGRLLEGFDCNYVSIIGILRNVGSRGTFAQFVGRAVRRTPNDNYPALVFAKARLQPMFDEYMQPIHADEDPSEDVDDWDAAPMDDDAQ